MTLAHETILTCLRNFPKESRRYFLEVIAKGNCPPIIAKRLAAKGESVKEYAAAAKEMLAELERSQ